MALQFKDAFWGDSFISNIGFETILQRVSDGRKTCKDMEDLLKMRASAEEKYGKELMTIARKAGGLYEICTLRTALDEMKKQIENVGSLHIQLSNLLKGEVKKIEAFREQQKEQRKKIEATMEKIQKTKVSLYKKTMDSQRLYEQRCREADEAEKSSEKISTLSTSTPKQIEKINSKSKQCQEAAVEAEKQYATNIEQLDLIRQEWDNTHVSTCEMLQHQEEDRILMTRDALWLQSNHFSMLCVQEDECYENARLSLERCDVIADINCFVVLNKTGSTPTDPIIYRNYRNDSTERNGKAGFVGGVMKRFSNLLQMSTVTTSTSSISDAVEPSTGGSSSNIYASVNKVPSPQETDTYTVIYDYVAQREDELSVSVGDVVVMVSRSDDGWWTVQKNGRTGFVPGSYLAQE